MSSYICREGDWDIYDDSSFNTTDKKYYKYYKCYNVNITNVKCKDYKYYKYYNVNITNVKCKYYKFYNIIIIIIIFKETKLTILIDN